MPPRSRRIPGVETDGRADGVEFEAMRPNQCPSAVESLTRRHASGAACLAPERDERRDRRIECAIGRPRDLHRTPDDRQEIAADHDRLAGPGLESTKLAVGAVVTHDAVEGGDSLERQAGCGPGLRFAGGIEGETDRQAHVDLRKLVRSGHNLRRLQSDRRKNDPNRA